MESIFTNLGSEKQIAKLHKGEECKEKQETETYNIFGTLKVKINRSVLKKTAFPKFISVCIKNHKPGDSSSCLP